MKYILTDLEIDLWEACNLRCAQCTHCAPLFSDDDEQYSYETFQQDLKTLNEVAHVKYLRIVGGEPLMNKNLLSYLKFIKETGICDTLTLFTNGLLLNSIDEEIFNTLDRLRISVYNLSEGTLKTIENNIKSVKERFPKLDVMPNRISYFNKVHTVDKNKNDELVKKIYENCYYSYGHGGLSIFNGRMYRCYVARKIYKYLKTNEKFVKDDFEYLKSNTHDSIAISLLTTDSIKEFTEQKTPLESCKWCLGSAGVVFKHRQLKKDEIDIATTEDLDFKQGQIYLSNLLLSWCIQKENKDIIEENKYFNPEFIKYYARQFKTKCFDDNSKDAPN